MYIHSSIFPTGQCLCHVEFVMGIDFSVCVFAEFEAFYVFDKMSYGLCRV
jgi:hypothetical protein